MKIADRNHACPEVLCLGQAVVDCITRRPSDDPHGAGKRIAESITLHVGGDAINEAAALTGMGRRAALICAVGADAAGRLILEDAKREGVDTAGVKIVPGMSTPVANIIVGQDGSRSSVSSQASRLPGYVPDLGPYAGDGTDSFGAEMSAAGLELSSAGAEASAGASLGRPRILSLASLFRAPLDDPEVIMHLVTEARRQGMMVCADTKLPTFRRLGLQDIAAVLPMIDFLFPNEEEAMYYTGGTSAEAAAEVLLSMGIRHVVIKCGAKGCYAACEEGRFALPAVPVRAVDTTGAGDNFVAGFLHALLDGHAFRACCEAGIQAAARSIVHAGGHA